MRVIETAAYKRLRQATNLVQPPGAASTAPDVPEEEKNPVEEQSDEREFPLYYINANTGQMENGPVCYAGDIMQQVANYAEMMVSGDITEFTVTSGAQEI